MKTQVFKLITILLILVTIFSACKKQQEVCGVENPLTDLLWLKEIIETHEKNDQWAKKQGVKTKHLKIYQCSYRDGTGFWFISYMGENFKNCEGEFLCGSIRGFNPQYKSCAEYNVSDKRKLIYRH